MRDQVLAYLDGLDLGTFAMSQELPFDNAGTALYLKNPKRVYVNVDQNATEVFLGLMGQNSIDMDVVSVIVYFANDAKNLPADYSDTVNAVVGAKSLYATNGFFKRDYLTSTEYDNDLMVTTIELRFYKLQ